MKKLNRMALSSIFAFMFILGMFLHPMNAHAEGDIKATIFALVEEGLDNDIEVTITNTEDESKSYTYTIKEADDWFLNIKLPEGKYVAKAKIPGFKEFASVRAASQSLPVRVSKDSEGYNTFTVLQARFDKIDKYATLININYEAGKNFKGKMNKEVAKKMVEAKEPLIHSPKDDDMSISPEDKKKADEEAKLDSGFSESDMEEPKKEEKAEKVETIQAEEENKGKRSLTMLELILVGLAFIGALVFWRYLKKKNEE